MYPGNKRKKLWREEKERLLKMTLEERRKEYLGDYVALKTIPTWMEDLKSKSESDEGLCCQHPDFWRAACRLHKWISEIK